MIGAVSRTRAVITALSVIPVLLVAGCTDDEPKPKFEPTPSETPSSASPTTSPAALSPEETVRAWVDAQNTALRTGDTSSLAALSADPCNTCDQFIDPIAQVYADGGSFRGGAWTIAAVKARPGGRSRTVVDVGIDIDGGTTQETSDSEPVEYVADKRIMQFRLVPVGGGWAISFIGFVS
jgi:hypothetical protein